MARGRSLSVAIKHSEVRRSYAEIVKELGDSASSTSRSYFYDRIAKKKNYSWGSVKAILNRKKKDIPENEFDLS